MQQIAFKREFSFLFLVVKTGNVQYLEEKIQLIKKIAIKKSGKKSLKIRILRNRDRFSKKCFRDFLTPYLGYLCTKFGTNRTFRLDVNFYTDRQIHWLIHRQTFSFIFIRDCKCTMYFDLYESVVSAIAFRSFEPIVSVHCI